MEDPVPPTNKEITVIIDKLQALLEKNSREQQIKNQEFTDIITNLKTICDKQVVNGYSKTTGKAILKTVLPEDVTGVTLTNTEIIRRFGIWNTVADKLLSTA